MLDYFFSLFSNDIAMDLGTANTLVYVKEKGIVLREPSVVAVEKERHRVLAVGNEAKLMLGRTPANIVAIRPMRNGVIADFEATQEMIKYFIQKVHNRRSLLHPRIVIGIPSGITEVEKRAVQESAQQAGAREVHLIEEPMAAAIGSDLPVDEPHGSMICDIGGGTTEVAVVSLGGMVLSRSLRVAGAQFDDDIVQFFQRKHGLFIGESTAEDVKFRIGSVYPLPNNEEKVIEVKGRDKVKGLPRIITVSSEEIRQALIESAKKIVEVIKEVLEETPPELSSDLVDRGVVLAGGGALMRGLPELIRQETELPVHRAVDPLSCVALGCGKYLENLDRIRYSKPIPEKHLTSN